MRLSLAIAAALLAATSGLYAQAPRDERVAKMKAAHEKAQRACEAKPAAERAACVRSEMCAQAKDRSACESRMAKAQAVSKARQACEGKEGDARRECMRRETCAQAKDPAQCEAQVKEAMAKREKIREACKGKEGEALRACIKEQRGKT